MRSTMPIYFKVLHCVRDEKALRIMTVNSEVLNVATAILDYRNFNRTREISSLLETIYADCFFSYVANQIRK